MDSKKLDLIIETNADFVVSMTLYDNNDNVIDLSGAIVESQLRQYAEASESIPFTVTHNGKGGRIRMSMVHELTATISYSTGVYDVVVTFPDGSKVKAVEGDVTVNPGATRPYEGQIMMMLAISGPNKLPYVGHPSRLYYDYTNNVIYRWTGTEYEILMGRAMWGTITGTLSEQTDLQNAINTKLSDAPSDGSEYVRKDGEWAVSSGGGGGGSGVWGAITGTLSNQTDLQKALDEKVDSSSVYSKTEADALLAAKANTADLGALANHDTVDYFTEIDNLPSAFPPEAHNHDERYYTENETDTLLSGKSNNGHIHDDRYFTEAEITALLAGKSDTSHNHDSDYSAIGHTHDDRYYTESEVDTLLGGKSDTGHTHDDRYYTESETDTFLSGKSDTNHNHDSAYSAIGHTHDDRYYTETEIDSLLTGKADSADVTNLADDVADLQTAVAGKADTGHTHDDRYYTESEVDTLLSGKSDTSHNHDSAYSALGHTHDDRYYTETEVDDLLDTKSDSGHNHDSRYYTETEVDTLLGGKANSSHAHGNITSAGAITSNATIASSDRLIIRDNSDSSKLTSSSITFDGSTTTKALTPKGTWETFAASSHTHDDRYYTETEVDNKLATKQDELDDSGWLTQTASTFTGNIYYRKIGNFVNFVGYSIKLKSPLTDSGIVLFTVPSGYRPKKQAVSCQTGNVASWAQIVIGTTGSFYFYKPSDESSWPTSRNINFNIFYMI